eukprot:CAMPEP_0184660638 /NCGR_PEP_ID=MMETSP0308-20130426/34523_1 /TAXON_ID=38269 /ORGANISM="Gloeochaete witrockiana, Strain SAG 46.84" /LENGTH=119 /DNA_ID=CAMNT_0027101343 /DNA_START=63 /DNA_END=422 /DNA_ORIENTATION=+
MGGSEVSPITTHVLDTALGRPAGGMPILLESVLENGTRFVEIARGLTDSNGRITNLLQPNSLQAGQYRMVFDTAKYFQSIATKGFYPVVQIHFEITSPNEHYHIPLLISPYGYSTYRGS